METKAIEAVTNIGSFFKKGWGVVSKTTSETATKIGNSQFGNTVKNGMGKAVDVTIAGAKVGLEKTKEYGGKIADGAVALGSKTADLTKKGYENTKQMISKGMEDRKKNDYFGGGTENRTPPPGDNN